MPISSTNNSHLPVEGVLLVNLGTPQSYSTNKVRRYLREFLMDKRVIDIPLWSRFLLVQGIIAPFRAPIAAKEYKKLWSPQGLPLQYHTQNLYKRVQQRLGTKYWVRYAMRYQHPGLKKVLRELQQRPLSKLHILPLFPQYASATTGSILEMCMQEISAWTTIPSIEIYGQFHLRDAFIQAWAERAKPLLKKSVYTHFLFSYHGLPIRQIRKASFNHYCQMSGCCDEFSSNNQYCYRAQCFQTTRALAHVLRLPLAKCRTAFQSRLGKSPWLQPYTADMLEELVKSGAQKLLVFSPAFVADCLETTIEIGEEYRDTFIKLGGKQLDLVESLNDSDTWCDAICDWIRKI